MPTHAIEQALTATNVAEREQVQVKTVREWLRTGRLPGYRLPGGAWRIDPTAYAAWRRNRQVEGTDEG